MSNDFINKDRVIRLVVTASLSERPVQHQSRHKSGMWIMWPMFGTRQARHKSE